MAANCSVAVVAAAGDVDRLRLPRVSAGGLSGICEPSRPAEGGEHCASVSALGAGGSGYVFDCTDRYA